MAGNSENKLKLNNYLWPIELSPKNIFHMLFCRLVRIKNGLFGTLS